MGKNGTIAGAVVYKKSEYKHKLQSTIEMSCEYYVS